MLRRTNERAKKLVSWPILLILAREVYVVAMPLRQLAAPHPSGKVRGALKGGVEFLRMQASKLAVIRCRNWRIIAQSYWSVVMGLLKAMAVAIPWILRISLFRR